MPWDQLRDISVAAVAELTALVTEWEKPGGYDQPRYSEHRQKCQERMLHLLESLRQAKRPEAAASEELDQFLRFAARLDAALDWDPRGPRFCRLRLAELEALAADLRAIGGGCHA